MTTAAQAHPAVARGRAVIAYEWFGVAVLIMVVLMGVLLILRPVATTRPQLDAGQVSTAAKLVSDHGMAMKELGERMATHGRQAQNDVWIGAGQHWSADGTALVQRSAQLMTLAAHLYLINPDRNATDLRTLQGDALVLRAHGQALVEHARVMRELTAVLEARAQGDERLNQDVQDSLAASEQMEQAGYSMTTAAVAFLDWIDPMIKSMGGGR